jgi:hypothetical protein
MTVTRGSSSTLEEEGLPEWPQNGGCVFFLNPKVQLRNPTKSVLILQILIGFLIVWCSGS